MESQPDRQFQYPVVREVVRVLPQTEHDNFIDDLTPAQKLAKVIDLNRNVVSLEEYRDGNQAA